MANVYIGKKFSSAKIRDIIDNGSASLNTKLIGFAIKIVTPTILSRFNESVVNPAYDISLTPIYISLQLGIEPLFSFSTGSSFIGLDEGELIPIRRSRFSAGKAETIEFYEKHLLDREFDMAFISREDMMLLSDYSDEIIISGSEINNGLPHLQPREMGTFFSFKIEGGLPVDFSDAENPLSIDVYPQMLFASPCPPYWRNPIGLSLISALLKEQVKGGDKEYERKELLELASGIYKNWVEFTMQEFDNNDLGLKEPNSTVQQNS